MARSFNGTTDYIQAASLGTGPSFGAPLSLSCWVYSTSIGAGQVGLCYGIDSSVGGGGTQYMIGLETNGAAFALDRVGGSGQTEATTAAVVSANTWNHIAGTFPVSASRSIYLNGGNKAVAGSTSDASRTGITIGMLNVGSGGLLAPMNGRIAECGIWSVTLTDAEVLSLSQGARCFTIRPASLIHYEPCDGISSPEPDLSGQGFNGVLTGTAKADGPPLMMFTPRHFVFWPPPVVVAGGRRSFNMPVIGM